MPCLKVCHKAVIKVLAGAAVLSRLGGGESISKLTHTFTGRCQGLRGHWPEPIVTCHVGLSIGLFTIWQLASLRGRDEQEEGREGKRERERERERERNQSYFKT